MYDGPVRAGWCIGIRWLRFDPRLEVIGERSERPDEPEVEPEPSARIGAKHRHWDSRSADPPYGIQRHLHTRAPRPAEQSPCEADRAATCRATRYDAKADTRPNAKCERHERRRVAVEGERAVFEANGSRRTATTRDVAKPPVGTRLDHALLTSFPASSLGLRHHVKLREPDRPALGVDEAALDGLGFVEIDGCPPATDASAAGYEPGDELRILDAPEPFGISAFARRDADCGRDRAIARRVVDGDLDRMLTVWNRRGIEGNRAGRRACARHDLHKRRPTARRYVLERFLHRAAAIDQHGELQYAAALVVRRDLHRLNAFDLGTLRDD